MKIDVLLISRRVLIDDLLIDLTPLTSLTPAGVAPAKFRMRARHAEEFNVPPESAMPAGFFPK